MPRFAASLTQTGSSDSSSAITGQEASRTISEIMSRACSPLTPSPTNARSGCSRSVAAATSATSSSLEITVVAEPGDDLGDSLEPILALVRNQNA